MRRPSVSCDYAVQGGDVDMEFMAELVSAMWSFVLADLKTWS
jgi:hypothetical protein